MTCLDQRSPKLSRTRACAVLGLSRSGTYPRHRDRRRPKVEHKRQPRQLAEAEREAVEEQLHDEANQDASPRVVHARELNAGRVLASVSTYYRILRDNGESNERRNQRPAQNHPVPRVIAAEPLAAWTWDITKLPTTVPRCYLNLYLILDLFSRFPVAWLISRKENAALARHLFRQALQRYAIEPGQLTVHQDRGAPMIATSYRQFLDGFGVQRSYSRPRVSNDNPYSEAINKTLKYSPGYPGRFTGIEHAREWTSGFMATYQHQPHEGLAGYSPHDVFYGHVDAVAARRQAALDAHYVAHPRRYPNGAPQAKRPPEVVTINADPADHTAADLLVASDNALTTQPPASEEPNVDTLN
jgi:putative transposase